MKCKDRAKWSSGSEATRQKVQVGEEEHMVRSKATSALGDLRAAPIEADC